MGVNKKISDFQESVGAIRKDKENPFHKNKYADINTVIEMITPELKKVGLWFTQTPTIADGIPILETILGELEGDESICGEMPLILVKNDMQAMGSALTYARRYMLVSMLGLEQQDDDGHRAVKKPKQPETLSKYLLQHHINPKLFAKHFQINTEEKAKELLKNKKDLDLMIEEFSGAVKLP